MNCANHPEVVAIAYCRTCGKALCETCRRSTAGTIYCPEHAPAAPQSEASPYTSAGPVPDAGASPGLAFLLGLIPGVGAIYNGQYVKGLIHVVVLGLLIGAVHSDQTPPAIQPLFGLMIAAWIFYMAFEAYHTARKRRSGQPVEEFSGLVRLRGQGSRFPVGPAILIILGVLFLLNNLDLLSMRQLFRYWPIALIAAGVYKLWERLSGREPDPQQTAQDHARTIEVATHEPQ
jgi:LiaI-LiaF-like transmembrane region/B-box zinc finger